MVQAAHSEHAGPKSSLGSDDSERIASQFSLTHTTYSLIPGACLRLSWYPLPGHDAALPSMQNRNILIHRAGISII